MRAILAQRTFRHLFAAQVIALLGTGLMTAFVAFGAMIGWAWVVSSGD